MTAPLYPEVNPNPDFAQIEEKILKFWQDNKIFERSVTARASLLPLPSGEGRGEGLTAKEISLALTGPHPALSQGERVKSNEFIFYDGPPFANGLPHYGHLLTGYVKDVFARYQTMRGHRVERRFGWDCHGLPAEMGAEKELGITGRAAIQNFGIGKFNEHCRTSVMKYTREWEQYVNRQARWVDFKHDYKTMDKNFMESVLWAFKQLYDKGLVYEAYRVMPYSWAAETPLSNFETKLDNSYREREDKAITVAFELNTPPHGAPAADKYYVLAWTTTPWTLPSNLALAVGKIMYVYLPATHQETNEKVCFIVGVNSAVTIADALSKNGYEFLPSEAGFEQIKYGSANKLAYTESVPSYKSLLGLSYHPLFPYFANHKHAFKILDGSNFVTDSDGTGIVHMAPGFGEDDQKCCEANGIELVVPVDGQGKYTDEVYDLTSPSPPVGEGGMGGNSPRIQASSVLRDPPLPSPPPQGGRELKLKGLNVIAEPGGSKFGLANDRIIEYLKKTGQLIKQETIKHNYPHCWRTDQPLIYRAMPSWYVEVTKFRERAAELNQQINWIPEHIRDGQMGHMLATAPDWSISRNRFWGTPIPVWRRQDSGSRSQDSGIKVFGSIAELEDFFDLDASLNSSLNPESRIPNPRITDLHRPFIDNLTIAKDGSKWQRVEDVFDCWFESGSMPFAQVHYPFENKEWFEQHFPADFITEYVGQTRGWFNTLIMLSTALFDKPPFKNCICHGVVLDAETGLKYSKRLKNYKDPMEVINQFGADALRWLMLASPVMRGQDLMVDPDGKFIRDVVRLAIKPIWNAYNFFCLYANADEIVASCELRVASENVMDRYILAKCKQAVETIQKSLDAYDTPSACDTVMQFFDALNNWYIRRNKERFWKTERDGDKQAAYDTLYTVLTTMCRAAAPLLPLTLDEIYKGLTGEESVHLVEFPSAIPGLSGDLEPRSVQPKIPAQGGDDDLMQQMDWVRDVCNTALAIRNKVNIRVRQPLNTIQLVGLLLIGTDKNTKENLLSIILDEINVKQCELLIDNLENYATPKITINSAILGKRLPAKMKQILPASKKGEWSMTTKNSVLIAGEEIYEGEFIRQLEPKPEYKDRAQALSSNDALVILDTAITPELEAEGIARDVVRMIQQARKDAGLNVSDRIALHIDAPEAIAQAIDTHRNYIMEQTLTQAFSAAPLTGSFRAENILDEQKLVISLKAA